MELRPVRIILISFYCFLLGLYFFSVTTNAVFGDNGMINTTDPVLWMPVGAGGTLAFVMVGVGVGVLYYSRVCWKILFFFLMVAVSTVVSLVLVTLFFLCFKPAIFFQYYMGIHIAPLAWFSFLGFFGAGIAVLYFLTREETLSYFGGMGPLIQPF